MWISLSRSRRAKKAEEMLSNGSHAWNAGIFLMRADCYIAELALHAPGMDREARAALAGVDLGARLIRPDAKRFASCPSDSIDYVVMERAEWVGLRFLRLVRGRQLRCARRNRQPGCERQHSFGRGGADRRTWVPLDDLAAGPVAARQEDRLSAQGAHPGVSPPGKCAISGMIRVPPFGIRPHGNSHEWN